MIAFIQKWERTTTQKIRKETEDLNNSINQMDLTHTYIHSSLPKDSKL